MQLRGIQGAPRLFEILDESGKSVLDVDAVKCGLSREIKRQLKHILILVCQAIEFQGLIGLKEFVDTGHLKKIERNARALKHNLWEIRSPAHGGRVFFVMDDGGNVIVSAVDKQKTTDASAQEKAINRGLNRWEKLLKV